MRRVDYSLVALFFLLSIVAGCTQGSIRVGNPPVPIGNPPDKVLMKIGVNFPRPNSIAEALTVELTALGEGDAPLPAEQNPTSTETTIAGFIEFEIASSANFDLQIALKLGSGEILASTKLENLIPQSQILNVNITLNTGEVLQGAVSVNPEDPVNPSPSPNPIEVGVQNCLSACDAFIQSGACDAFPDKEIFCLPENRQATCESRYNNNPNCIEEFLALDACFATTFSFDCSDSSPVSQEIPYQSSDFCIAEKNALDACLNDAGI